ncbi:hypothetical protein D3C81_1819190 [compost metagenome]
MSHPLRLFTQLADQIQAEGTYNDNPRNRERPLLIIGYRGHQERHSPYSKEHQECHKIEAKEIPCMERSLIHNEQQIPSEPG